MLSSVDHRGLAVGFDTLKSLVEWAGELSFVPKLLLTIIVLVLFVGGAALFVVLAWTRPPGIVYDAEVVELKRAALDPVSGMIEPFPGFPYYSEASDHPTQWPPRLFQDREGLAALIEKSISAEVKAELQNWPQRLQVLNLVGGDIDESLVEYARLRLLLAENRNSPEAIRQIVGPHAAQALAALERKRAEIARSLPNRMLALRVRNEKSVDAEHFTVEVQVAGAVYDVTLNLQGQAAKSQQWTPNRFSVEIPRLRPGYTADVQVWYQYQPLSERVFAGRRDVEWGATEGVVIQNLGISNNRARQDSALLDDLEPYHRYPVDPVRGSPTFGRLPEPPPPPARPRAQPAVQPLPSGPGPYALLIATQSFGKQPTEAEAKAATEALAKALASFRIALAQLAGRDGAWLYEHVVAAKAGYNSFAGAFLMEGGLRAILRADRPLDVAALPGWAEISAAGSAAFEHRPWNEARYEAVLHFFTDDDAREDSKRLLTQPLPLSDIFDETRARAGERNAVAPVFADLLRFAAERLKRQYGLAYTLRKSDEQPPFYLVVRGTPVSENFYLPAAWIALAEAGGAIATPVAGLRARLSRLYDYAEQSRQLAPAEFAAIFDP